MVVCPGFRCTLDYSWHRSLKENSLIFPFMFLWLLSLEKDWRSTTEFNLLHRGEPHNSPMRKHFETETAVQLQLSLFRQLSQLWNVRQFPESTKKSFLPFLLTLREGNTVWCMTLIRKSTRYPHKDKWSNRVTHIHKAGRYFVNRQDKEGGKITWLTVKNRFHCQPCDFTGREEMKRLNCCHLDFSIV